MVTRWITLLTDFGLSDNYVGVMKGAIATLAPTAQVIDLTHHIPPQDIRAARFQWMTAYPYFPSGTIHVAVVDPGVGSQRRAVVLELAEGILVAPDNGIASGILQQHSCRRAIALTRSSYWRTAQPSATFHGRDIFAPVAAHLANGVPLPELGEDISPASLVNEPIPWTQTGDRLSGCIQSIDHFGNLITSIPASAVVGVRWSLYLGDRAIPVGITYSDVPPGTPLALVGSHGWLEIAVNQGNAAQMLAIAPPSSVIVTLHQP